MYLRVKKIDILFKIKTLRNRSDEIVSGSGKCIVLKDSMVMDIVSFDDGEYKDDKYP